MSNPRADIFDENTDDLDLDGFEPKQHDKSTKPINTREQVRAVTEANKFTSRSATPSKPRRRIYRTGRNVQLNIKANRTTVETFYRIADQQGWVLGETLERALEVLDKSLKSNTE